MKIAVESGKRAPFSFENSKIKVEGSKGIYYNGNISISSDNKVMYAGGNSNLQARAVDSMTSQHNTSSSAQTTKTSSQSSNSQPSSLSAQPVKEINKVSLSSIGVSSQSKQILSSGQKLSLLDLGLKDNKLVIGVDLEFNSSSFEVDFSMFLIDENGKSSEENFIFYGNKVSKDTSVKIDDDFSLGIVKAFNSVISIDLDKLDSNIKRISLTGTLYDESNKFGNLKSASLSLITNAKEEVLSYNFSEKLSNENAIVICDFYLHNGNWKLQGIGQGFNGGLAALCNNFGVDTM